MKSVFIVYHDLKSNGRSQEILETSMHIADTTLVSYSKPDKILGFKYIETGKGKRKYLPFILGAVKSLWKEKPDLLFLHDNYTAILIFIAHIITKRSYIVYDSSELYIERSKTSRRACAANALRFFEKKFIKCANTRIAANLERAEIMQKYFDLSTRPLVFDNVRMIRDEYDLNNCINKYGHLFDKDVFHIVYAGGIAKHRKTYEIVEAVGLLGKDYQLIIVGQATDEETTKFDMFLRNNAIHNVVYLGFIPRSEWRYLLANSKISISAFDQNTINNKYCASGKLYESLFEGVPILTSENPPLKRLCEEHQIGVSTSDFYSGIIEIKNNYVKYQTNVKKYVQSIDYDSRIIKLAEAIIDDISKNIAK